MGPPKLATPVMAMAGPVPACVPGARPCARVAYCVRSSFSNVGVRVEIASTVTAPATPGTYNFEWRMVQDGVMWFGVETPNVVVTVSSGPANATFVSQTVPTTMAPGQMVNVSVTMRNTGGTAWTPGTFYRLGAVNPYDNGNWGMTRVGLAAQVPLVQINDQMRLVLRTSGDGVDQTGPAEHATVQMAGPRLQGGRLGRTVQQVVEQVAYEPYGGGARRHRLRPAGTVGADDDVVAVLDRAGVERANFFGYSMGGRIAYGLGLHAPERFESFIIGGGSFSAEPDGFDRATFPGALETIATDGIEAFLDRWREQLRMPLPPGVREMYLANDHQALVAYLRRTQREPSHEAALARMTMP